MSATIGDTADLARRLGTQPIIKIPIPVEHSTTTYGRRMLVINKIEDLDIPGRLAVAILDGDVEDELSRMTAWIKANGAMDIRLHEPVTDGQW